MHLDPWILNILIVASVRILFLEFELTRECNLRAKVVKHRVNSNTYNKYRNNLVVNMIWVFFTTMSYKTRVVKKHLHKVFFSIDIDFYMMRVILLKRSNISN